MVNLNKKAEELAKKSKNIEIKEDKELNPMKKEELKEELKEEEKPKKQTAKKQTAKKQTKKSLETKMTGGAMKLGELYGREIKNLDNEITNFTKRDLNSFMNGMKRVIGSGLGKEKKEQTKKEKQVKKRVLNKSGGMKSGGKRTERNALISKLMREKGLKLGEASKYIKEHNLM